MRCSHPKIINGRIVSCGHCVNCRKIRINDWYIRMRDEASYVGFDKCSFLTLTYNDDNLPKYGLLVKKDYQNFLKRLRITLYRLGFVAESHFSYFCCGEYGSKNLRPHYHFCFFGLSPKFRDIIEKCWNKGFICVKSISRNHFRYVSKYCVKNFNAEKIDFDTGEVISEFTTMSRRSGLGFCSFINDWAKCVQMISDGFVKDGNFTYSLPLSYLRKIYSVYSIKKLPSSCTIYYNDKLYNNTNFLHAFDDYFKSVITSDHPLYQFFSLKDKDCNFFKIFCSGNLKFEPMTFLCNKISFNISKGRDYFFKIHKDFDRYYHSNFKDNGFLKEPSKILDFLNDYYNFLFVLQ